MKLLNTTTVPQARKAMRRAFDNSPGFKYAYVANIAMLLYDKYGGIFLDRKTREEAGEEILKLVFWRDA
jgi:hypothetical protein